MIAGVEEAIEKGDAWRASVGWSWPAEDGRPGRKSEGEGWSEMGARKEPEEGLTIFLE